MSEGEAGARLSAFEEWWADMSPEFDVDPDYPLTDDHRGMAEAGWQARDSEVEALRQRAEAAEARERALVAERDLIYDDIGHLLEAVGMGDHARPESPREVFMAAVERVRQLRETDGQYVKGRQDVLVAVCQFLRAYADTFTESPMARVSLRKAAMLLEKKPETLDRAALGEGQ